MVRVKAGQANGDLARSPAQAVGLAVRHMAVPGLPLRLAELVRPPLVQKGQQVAVALEEPGMALAVEGEALEQGALGEHVRVLNPASHAVLEGEVTGIGRVRVVPGSHAALCLSPLQPGSRPMKAQYASLAALLLLTGCGSLTRLSEVGRPPAMTASSDPTSDPKWRPVNMPMPHAEPPPADDNSLWRSGSRAFFKDQRASQVGDIVTVVVSIADVANLQNNSSQGNTGSESMGLPNLFGLEGALPRIIKAVNPSSLVSTNSAGNSTGTGQIKRNEQVQLRLAGVVTQVLPNGNLVVEARQEVRVNSELREPAGHRRGAPAGHRERQHGAA